jgi:phosphopantetheine adenylyltransferase
MRYVFVGTFDVLLTVHLRIIIAADQLIAQILVL